MAGRKQTASSAPRIVGADAGAVSVSVAEIAPSGEVLDSAYAFHGGQIDRTLQHLLETLGIDADTVLAATCSAPRRLEAAFRCDGRIAVITAARHIFGDVGALLTVGGERFGIVYFDPAGGFRGFRANTSCAAGTGSFLDQQARGGKRRVADHLRRAHVEVEVVLREDVRHHHHRDLARDLS